MCFWLSIIILKSFIFSVFSVPFRNRIYTFGKSNGFLLASNFPDEIFVSTKQLIENYPGSTPNNGYANRREILDICSASVMTLFLLDNGTAYVVADNIPDPIFVPKIVNVGRDSVESIRCGHEAGFFRTVNNNIFGAGYNMWNRLGPDCGMCYYFPDQPANMRDGEIGGTSEVEIEYLEYGVGELNAIVALKNHSCEGENCRYLMARGLALWGLIGKGEDFLSGSSYEWIRMNDSVIGKEFEKGNMVMKTSYVGVDSLFVLLENSTIYFLGQNAKSGCISLTGSSGITSTVLKLPIDDGSCYHGIYYSELEGKQIMDIQCCDDSCFAVCNDNYVYSWGFFSGGGNNHTIGRVYVTDSKDVPKRLNMLSMSSNSTIQDFLVHHLTKYAIVLDDKDTFVYAFGDNSYYHFNGETVAHFDFLVQVLVNFDYLNDIVLSTGFQSQSLFLLLSTTCDGYYSNDTENVCSAKGICYEFDECSCYDGWYLEFCSDALCYYVFSSLKQYVCSGHGNCTYSDYCECEDDYIFSEDCSEWECFGVRNENISVCQGNGQCIAPDECQCRFVQTGTDLVTCEIPKCFSFFANEENVCSKNGMCVSKDACECSQGFEGYECESKINNDWIIATVSGGGVFIVSGILMFFFYCCCICCCIFIVLLFCRFCISLQRNLSKFKEIQDVDLIIESQKMEKDSSLAHININKSLYIVKKEEIKLIKVLGEGGSDSVVYLSEWKGKNVAFKCFKARSVCSSQNSYDTFESEIEILQSINHPHIIQYYGSCFSPPRIGFVMEYCENGDLIEFISRKQEKQELFPLREKIRILIEICLAMSFLHSKKIIHRDLKLDNILLTSNLTTKLMDFGLSKFYEQTQQVKTNLIGTTFYMSPEIVLGKNYNEKTDIFSFAILIFSLITEKFNPYKGMDIHGLEFKVANSPVFRPRFKGLEPEFPSILKELCKKCWNHAPLKRPSFDEIINSLQENKKDLENQSNKMSIENNKDEEEEMKLIVEESNLLKEELGKEEERIKSFKIEFMKVCKRSEKMDKKFLDEINLILTED